MSSHPDLAGDRLAHDAPSYPDSDNIETAPILVVSATRSTTLLTTRATNRRRAALSYVVTRRELWAWIVLVLALAAIAYVVPGVSTARHDHRQVGQQRTIRHRDAIAGHATGERNRRRPRLLAGCLESAGGSPCAGGHLRLRARVCRVGQFTGTTFGWFRFYILAIPMVIVIAMCCSAPVRDRGRHSEKPRTAAKFGAALLSASLLVFPVTATAMLNPTSVTSTCNSAGGRYSIRNAIHPVNSGTP